MFSFCLFSNLAIERAGKTIERCPANDDLIQKQSDDIIEFLLDKAQKFSICLPVKLPLALLRCLSGRNNAGDSPAAHNTTRSLPTSSSSSHAQARLPMLALMPAALERDNGISTLASDYGPRPHESISRSWENTSLSERIPRHLRHREATQGRCPRVQSHRAMGALAKGAPGTGRRRCCPGSQSRRRPHQ
jgi:hypothetical protein